jgi:hypothetical protein
MNAIGEALKEFIGLFVDDGSLAIATVVWIVIVAFGLASVPTVAVWRGPLFAVGIAVILVENVVRSARR